MTPPARAGPYRSRRWILQLFSRAGVVSQFESRDWEVDLWLLVTSTMRRTGSVQPRLGVTSAHDILKNAGGRFTAWQNLSTD
jgi:hypothetical protein